MTKKWYRSKTLWLNAISAGLIVVEANIGVVRSMFGPTSYLALIGALAAANAFLRCITSQPIK